MTTCTFVAPSARTLLAGLAVCCVWALPAHAIDRTWTDADNDGLWGNGLNWSASTRPDQDDHALLGPDSPAGFTIDLGGINRPVDELTFSGSTGFTLNNGTLQLVGRSLNATGSAAHILNTLVIFNSVPFTAGTGPANLDIGGTASIELAGGIDDSGFFSLSKGGTGTLILPTANSYSALTFIDAGTIQIAHPDALQNSTTVINTDGGLDITTHGIDANLFSLAGSGAFDLGGQTVTVEQGDYSGVLTGTGSLVKTVGADLRLSGANTYTGTTTIEGGTLIVSNSAGSATGSGQVTLIEGTGLMGAGIMNGELTVRRFTTVAPGETGEDAAGTLTVGNVDFARNSVLELELGGGEDTNTHDQLRVTGDLTIDPVAILEVLLLDGFAPATGSAFHVLDAQGTTTGAFGNLDLPALAAGQGWNLANLYTTGELRVDLLGDLDADGFVGAADLDILLAHWGQTVSAFDYAAGDPTGDGLVGQADLDLVMAQFGSGTPGSGVPEPGSLALLGVGAVALTRRRRRRA